MWFSKFLLYYVDAKPATKAAVISRNIPVTNSILTFFFIKRLFNCSGNKYTMQKPGTTVKGRLILVKETLKPAWQADVYLSLDHEQEFNIRSDWRDGRFHSWDHCGSACLDQ